MIYAIAGREETAQSGRSPRRVNSFTAAGLSTIATFEKHVGHNGFIDLYGNSITISRKVARPTRRHQLTLLLAMEMKGATRNPVVSRYPFLRLVGLHNHDAL